DYNVGIGTDNPKAKLHVNGGLRTKKGNANGDGSNVGYAFELDGDTGMFAVGGASTHNSELQFKIDSQPRLTLKNNGKIGIGTTNPEMKVEIDAGDSWAFRSTVNHSTGWGQNIIGRVSRKDTAAFVVNLKNANTNKDTFYVVGDGWIYSQGHYLGSDIALKKDIEPLENSLQKVLNLKGVTFRFKEDSETSSKKIGLIAQEVEKIVPEVVQDGRDGIKMVAYQNLVALVIEATKEQQSQIELLKAQNDALKAIVCKDDPEEAICQ
ncbi:MAG: tail fiber domain-containing protein, partial [Candidatus Parabeggiatoa sp.]|nr:tail fiber domain-containing protein [Candidatus Parabeggiatoa sp.]